MKKTFLWSKIGLGFGELGAHTPTKNSKEYLPGLISSRKSRTALFIVWQLLYKNSINIENQHTEVFVIYGDELNPKEKVLGHNIP